MIGLDLFRNVGDRSLGRKAEGAGFSEGLTARGCA
jgi:hypothetical protein